MKKALAILLVCLSSTVLFAQTLPTHWTPVATTGSMTYSAVVTIDGVEVNNSNIEIGAFVVGNEGVCRGANRAQVFPITGRYIFSFGIFGDSGEQFTFKLYDWTSEQELDLVSPEPLTYVENNIVGNAFTPYVFAFTTPSAGIEKEIAAWTVEASGDVDQSNGWYLLATPVGTVVPGQVENLTSNEYDLYRFDQAASDGLEWINLKGSNESLVPGTGYLYANSGGELDTITITFPGAAYTEAVTVDLTHEDGFGLAGWNLVGNPWNANAYVGTSSFYVMNEARTEIAVPNRNYLEPMEGAFFYTESDTQLSFSAEEPSASPDAMLALNVSRDSKVVDRAVVSFGSERTLPKFQLNPSHTKVYIPQENRDYAVVAAGEMGEMPVGFKAERNGSYTLDFTAQAVTFAYLHLIDNKTGKDVDLLESPAYSFDALTTDYASRFKLVFATGNATDDNFAFCSNGNWIISNDGEATLQVVDVTGRILSSETVSGCVSKAISAAPGVYMLRLINGDNMKVQKVVVK